MSATKIDLPKVCQMLDAGWRIGLFKNGLNTYSATANHPEPGRVASCIGMLWGRYSKGQSSEEFAESHIVEDEVDDDATIITDDFTPEQALTRLAYKLHGEII